MEASIIEIIGIFVAACAGYVGLYYVCDAVSRVVEEHIFGKESNND